MVLAQSIISFPLVAGFTMAAVMGVEPQLRQQVQAWGPRGCRSQRRYSQRRASGWWSRSSPGSVASFRGGRGNARRGQHRGRTRVLTSAIMLETRKGAFDLALALGAILLGLSFAANLAMLQLQGRALHE